MKVVTVFILSVASLAILSVQFLKTSEASGDSFSIYEQFIPPAGPGPQSVEPTPTPSCSPKHTREEDKNDPNRELTAEEELDAQLGTSDWDCDGICNAKDNCIFAYNPGQLDGDQDGKGDACAPNLVDASFKDSRCDKDGDGVPDFRDNSPLACNPNQRFADLNKNGVNDLCDSASASYQPGQSCRRRVKVVSPEIKRPTNSRRK
jgi:hypothetical protein